MSTASIYFIGIGGTAMASVAVALSQEGYSVSGSDSALYPPMSDYLAAHAIACLEGYDADHLAARQPDIVVAGNAVSRGNPEIEYALNQRMSIRSMPEIVREMLIGQHTSVVVAGTHGKTTTTSLIAWLLDHGGLQPGFLVGGIAENFGCGCRPSGLERNGWFITEGDEYDTAFFDKRSKFIHYRPDIAVINNIEFDHADIFSSLEDIKRSFRNYISLIPSEGLLLTNDHDPVARELSRDALCRVETFGTAPESTWSAQQIDLNQKGTSFNLYYNVEPVGNMTTPLYGTHNLLNTICAIAISRHAGIPVETIGRGLGAFKGPKRRMELVGEYAESITLLDDFAHHPTAVRKTLEAVRQRFPGRRIIACFEPRSNTSTRNTFQGLYAESFDAADSIVLGKVHRPERYGQHERLDTQRLVSDLQARGKTAWAAGSNSGPYPAELLAYIRGHVQQGDVIILLSNGNFEGLKTMLSESFAKIS
ncbi:UDP-N-acetylmuramate:L-alanyl-gamma-D-glutamyl-meso-diaminopimelate ligase [Prosthecochloris sp. HL-130-GSB]|uniref:UDP-N-acetylmuramate:L-alanyl-gamma-D-glutamyl- meso-diaminopimelate ligase n=1 Tax=Prosthecochloris sp. HL-130-GSB TaxID=1974213 RepID=UPI000A1C0CCE|nr:UDP-N-acetylmuramate:L-alanyl-gamma-D-glutamyl-meso-diaminopimelate ligase [Prosthecochloris sp. HL-130-GSB]ARM30614.1 UDP-N-acetylmuramate:L-alanyl-gamma-D-glutamyl-meso-diaminopimelate ligase [Prosthecochloris sp. HL-130-GSB]